MGDRVMFRVDFMETRSRQRKIAKEQCKINRKKKAFFKRFKGKYLHRWCDDPDFIIWVSDELDFWGEAQCYKYIQKDHTRGHRVRISNYDPKRYTEIDPDKYWVESIKLDSMSMGLTFTSEGKLYAGCQTINHEDVHTLYETLGRFLKAVK